MAGGPFIQGFFESNSSAIGMPTSLLLFFGWLLPLIKLARETHSSQKKPPSEAVCASDADKFDLLLTSKFRLLELSNEDDSEISSQPINGRSFVVASRSSVRLFRRGLSEESADLPRPAISPELDFLLLLKDLLTLESDSCFLSELRRPALSAKLAPLLLLRDLLKLVSECIVSKEPRIDPLRFFALLRRLLLAEAELLWSDE